jgi:hypothetical protein
MGKLILASLLGLLLIGAATAAPRRASDDLQLIDLTDDYGRVWAEAQQRPEPERVRYFKQAFAEILPGFYDSARVAPFGIAPERYDAMLAKALASYPERRERIARVASQFTTLFTPARKSFEIAFGPMRGYPPIYLVDSLGEFDGGTRDLPDGTRLLFGADMIARLHAGKPIQPFFHHELFHLLHARTFHECAKVWCSLWAEGLAVHVAAMLNPGADDEALLLTSPEPLRPAVDAHRTEAVCAVAARLESEDSGSLFTGGGKPTSATLPPRFAYYVGYLVAQDLGRGRSLKQLAALPAEQVLPLVRDSLGRLADCA